MPVPSTVVPVDSAMRAPKMSLLAPLRVSAQTTNALAPRSVLADGVNCVNVAFDAVRAVVSSLVPDELNRMYWMSPPTVRLSLQNRPRIEPARPSVGPVSRLLPVPTGAAAPTAPAVETVLPNTPNAALSRRSCHATKYELPD